MYRLLFSHKKCSNPTWIGLMLWYMVVFTAIMYFFVENGIILTFG
jgi:hypothetical protein